MRGSRILALAILSMALVVPSGYGASLVLSDESINTEAFQVDFEKPKVMEKSEGIEVNTQQSGKRLNLYVTQLYPGAVFDVEVMAVNRGELEAQIDKVELVTHSTGSNDEDYNSLLMEYIEGYDYKGSIYKGQKDYGNYLVSAYENTVIMPGENVKLRFKMGLSKEVVGFQNQKVSFSIRILLSQSVEALPDVEDIPFLKDEPQSFEEMPRGRERSTGGKVEQIPPEIPSKTSLEEFIPSEGIEKEFILGEKLPQTGGLSKYMIYAIGIFIFGVGIAIYRKK